MVDNEIAMQNLTKDGEAETVCMPIRKALRRGIQSGDHCDEGGSRRWRPDRCPGSRDVSCARQKRRMPMPAFRMDVRRKKS